MRTQETYPHLFEICPLTMRTQGILLIKDAALFMSITSAEGGLSHPVVSPSDPLCFGIGTRPSQWKEICDELVTRLDRYSNVLLRNIRAFTEAGDNYGAEIIQGSCIPCLAYLAALCGFASRLEPNSGLQVHVICDSSLERLGRLTQEMKFDEYTYLDVLLRVRHPGGRQHSRRW
jgi:hypothetical protein